MFGYNHHIVQQDMKELAALSLPWDKLANKSILVTGANGMLATYLIYTLLYVSQHQNISLRVIALSRTLSKMKQLFADFEHSERLTLLAQDICEPVAYEGNIDYIYHFAGNASPYFIKNDPVGIVKSNMLGTLNVVELAKQQSCDKVIFASTREVYGATGFEELREDTFGYVDPLDNRSCYPESKRAAETIMRSYYLQYGVKCVAARIAHSYGPGMKIDNDGRVMSDFIYNAVNNHDITLLSDGSAIRAFCYITDAIQGLLLMTFFGKDGEAYNLANETEPKPIGEVAQMIADIFPEKGMRVKYKKADDTSGYCNYKRVGLSTKKLEELGFKPSVSLLDGLKRTITSFE